MEKASYTTRIK